LRIGAFRSPSHGRKSLTVTLESIRAAQQRIGSHIYLSPAPHSAELSEITGQQVFLKLDNLQRTGAFKERGALNKILTLTDDERRQGSSPPAPAITLRPSPSTPASAVFALASSCR